MECQVVIVTRVIYWWESPSFGCDCKVEFLGGRGFAGK